MIAELLENQTNFRSYHQKTTFYQLPEKPNYQEKPGDNYRSSHRRCSVKKVVLKNFANFTGKHLCWSIFFNKVAGLTPILKDISEQLLL